MPLKSTAGNHGEPAKGRGAPANPEGRFEHWSRESADDGWFQDPGDEPSRPKTVVAIEHAKSIVSRHDSPDVGFAQSLNPYRGCEHGCTYCTGPDTPILLGNGRTLPISELRPGDEIYGTKREGWYRRYVKCRVLDHWSVIKPAYRVTLEDGTELITSGDHRLLTERGWKYVTGTRQGSGRRPVLTLSNKLMGTGAFAEAVCESEDYRRGYLCGMVRGDGCDSEALLRTQDYLFDLGIDTGELLYKAAAGGCREMHAIRASAKWRVDAIRELVAWPNAMSREWCAGYLAGLFDAEGSFSDTVWRVPNTDAEIIGWLRKCLEMFGFTYAMEHQHFEDRKPLDTVRMKGGLREHLRFFHTVRPAITRKLDLTGQAIKSDAKLRVASIEPLGKAMRLYDITTETGDFIANGVVSHNCFARPSHAYLGLSPGLDFETRISAKVNAAELWREAIAKPGYRCEPLTIGVNTDAYQPIERKYRITRSVLEVAAETDHPVTLITKSALIERDLDLLAPMAAKRLVSVTFSITTLNPEVSRHMEPRTSAPQRRLTAVKRLSEAGIPVSVNVAPVIPFLTDFELEPILEAAAEAGATGAGYQLVRLPWEVKDLFKEWLETHFPLKAAHVMARVREMREGRENDPRFGSRMTGVGLFADLLEKRFEIACRRFGLNAADRDRDLDCSRFRPPSRHGQQRLF